MVVLSGMRGNLNQRGEGYSSPLVDLTNCDREPIRVPGSIQAHGFLLGLTLVDDHPPQVIVASENASAFLHRPISQILGARLEELLPSKSSSLFDGRTLRQAANPGSAQFLGTVCLPGDANSEDEFEVVGYGASGMQVLEFERANGSISQAELNTVIARFASTLEQPQSASDLCESITVQIRQLTGFDRVMLYQFDEEGHGTVLAEDRNDRLPSYLGLRFPASDIPRQARELYLLNRVRIIPDVEYLPSPLIAAEGRIEPTSLDLSLSVLRSVSPIHRDYMRNMGTISSMSISIVSQGKLWGLISAHHHEPKSVPYLTRSACDVLTRIMSAQLLALQQASEMAHAIRLKSIHTQLLTYMAAGESYIDGLARHPVELCALTGSQGAAIVVDDRCICLGEAPSEADVLRLSVYLSERLKDDVYATSELSAESEEFRPLSPRASGVLAISMSQVHRMQIVWFRPEVVQTVNWAGEPEKGHKVIEGVLQIHPRHSFSSWKEIVRDKSDAWSAVEIESAREFRKAVLEIVLRKAEELADIALELEVTNRELEAFSYSVSHDLRAPFRHISGFAELLIEEEAAGLSERGRKYLTTIAESAQFAGLLVDSLLNFSRLSRTPLDLRPLPMTMLAEDVWNDVVKQELKGRVVSFNIDELPTVTTDINLMRQVWRNLLSNAAKYTRKRENPSVFVKASFTPAEVVFSVADNGVGFENQYAHKLFGVFQRLHRMEDFEGTGIGLANVRRIITRMGGRTWAEGQPDIGATFFFSLPSKTITKPAQLPVSQNL
ncbi:MAG TPA: ATP-binding protein [Acidobacteriaceae bacterium]|nr:ATP-binding protein [Acidobacteriaceae bacterium]